MCKKLLLMVCFFLPNILMANEGLAIVAIGEARQQVEQIVIDGPYFRKILKAGQIELGHKVQEIIKNDLGFYQKRFKVEMIKQDKIKNIETVKYNDQSQKGVKILIRYELREDENKGLKVRFLAWNITNEKNFVELEKNITKENFRTQAHFIADNIYKRLTGKDSIFKSKIIFVSDKGLKKGSKELYIMDFDGGQKKRLTYHHGTVISPAISYDQNKVVYSLIQGERSKKRNVNLYILDLKTKKKRLLSSRKGINSGAIFMPGDNKVLLTLSFAGNAELYLMDILSKKLKRVTKHFSLDVDPSINKSGSLLAFLSGRSGKAMIYTMDPRGLEKDVKRVSYVGKYNATPRFSPSGEEIVFSSWLDERFDLFRINADGSGLSRLTKDFGSNEDPTYSNDGQFIAFSSQRVLSRNKATHHIYIMDKDGTIVANLTKKFGNCITPRWTK